MWILTNINREYALEIFLLISKLNEIKKVQFFLLVKINEMKKAHILKVLWLLSLKKIKEIKTQLYDYQKFWVLLYSKKIVTM